MLIPLGTQNIETQRLCLRRFANEDVESVFRNWASDPQLQDAYGEPAYEKREDVKVWIDQAVQSYGKGAYRWAIIEQRSGECIGQIAFFLVDEKNQFCEIEYCIGRDFQRRGFAVEATRAVIDYGFARAHFHRIQICCRESNLASKGVIEKCGFVYEGMLRDYFYRQGSFESRLYFSLLEEEYRQVSVSHIDES
jgi:ribosomal-protein-alanine N-acetyltransferase